MELNNITPVCGFKDIKGNFFERESEAIKSSISINAIDELTEFFDKIYSTTYSPDEPVYSYDHRRKFAVTEAILRILSSGNNIIMLRQLADKWEEYYKQQVIVVPDIPMDDVKLSLIQKIKSWFNGR